MGWVGTILLFYITQKITIIFIYEVFYDKIILKSTKRKFFKNMPQILLPRNSHQHLEYFISTGPCA